MLYSFIFFILLISFLFFTNKKNHLPILKVIFIAVVIRVTILILFSKSSSQDLVSFLTSGNAILKKEHFYPSLYFPFFPYLGALSLLLSRFFNPLIFLKVVVSLFDVGIVYLIYLLSNNSNLALIYALNPPSIITTSIHGQFDSIPLFFLLLGIYLFQKKLNLLSVLVLSFAIYTKTWPILFIYPLFRLSKNKFSFIFIFIFPLLSLLLHSYIFKIPVKDIFLPIKNYRGLFGVWGISNILTILNILFFAKINSAFIPAVRRISLMVCLFFSFVYTFKNPIKGIFILMLFFFVFTPTFGAQWLSWIIPFLILEKPKFFKPFFIISTIYLGLTFYINVSALPKNFVHTWESAVSAIGFCTWAIILLIFLKSFKGFAKPSVLLSQIKQGWKFKYDFF